MISANSLPNPYPQPVPQSVPTLLIHISLLEIKEGGSTTVFPMGYFTIFPSAVSCYISWINDEIAYFS